MRKPSKLDFGTFQKTRPKPVGVRRGAELVTTRTFADWPDSPLVIEPAEPGVDLVAWTSENRQLVDRHLAAHGAVLFRGFGIDTPETFESFSRAVCTQLFTTNTEHVPVAGNVATPVFYPADQQLLWHNENSFNLSWPTRILFACATPAESGGETPIVDSCELYRRLDPALRERFSEHGVMYQRSYGDGLGLTWQEVFDTEDQAQVEASCKATQTTWEWKDNGRLVTRFVRPAVVRHEVTGALSWFNQAQHWHISCIDPQARESLKALYPQDELPRNCYYGDGSPIADQEMQSILALYSELEIFFPWQRGDAMVVDNVLMAHGRNPYTGERRILVTMGDLRTYSENEPPQSLS